MLVVLFEGLKAFMQLKIPSWRRKKKKLLYKFKKKLQIFFQLQFSYFSTSKTWIWIRIHKRPGSGSRFNEYGSAAEHMNTYVMGKGVQYIFRDTLIELSDSLQPAER